MGNDRVRAMQGLFAAALETSCAAWHPAADIYRTRAGWLVKFDLAGVRPGDVELTARGQCLTVRGSRRDCSLEEGACHYLLEIVYSDFERSVVLPCDLDRATISAEHRDGMLLVRIQREEHDQ